MLTLHDTHHQRKLQSPCASVSHRAQASVSVRPRNAAMAGRMPWEITVLTPEAWSWWITVLTSLTNGRSHAAE